MSFSNTYVKARRREEIVMTILLVSLLLLGFVGWIYEIRNETEEDKKKKLWLFEHGLY